MNIDNRNSVLLALISLIAFTTVLFGFARIDTGEASEQTFAEEKQELVETAQLWYIRPVAKGGGGMSFDNLDFQRLSYSDYPRSLGCEGRRGHYRIANRQSNYFVLSSIALAGSAVKFDTIRFDTLP